ncbi:hypothetical protein BO83DRAFT_425886 [Aspergillus eucalypticola CBS 122712]|uniref:Diels-Alderase N-terminal domain-containing protein n=1 Tax=Aspergillus eucalypticola (strain CBS 122712 / IBT 29274) TaxID=1448314 RepID=A0A317VRT3_ASPEC|nr:uncharacterized protein BO83DRAFT_425886 [Aspergillus eucalypticola CBS 122712]PWY75592.1 hypothetical protein BO83DRAFT_425886 [Aspergillus eucalypticola CBS 122712]
MNHEALLQLYKILSELAYLTLPFCLSAAALSTQKCPPVKDIKTYQTTPQDSQADGQFTSCDNFSNSPKMQDINASSYNWWYFDAIGTDGVSSPAVVFFVEANRSGFTVTENFTNMDFIQVSALSPTVLSSATSSLPIMQLCPPTVMDLADYVLTLDAEDLGYKGSFSMHSIAPPRYPCSPKRGNVSSSLGLMEKSSYTTI